MGLVDLTVCALFPVLKRRVELLKVPKRRKDHTGGGGPELLAKMLKEHCRFLNLFLAHKDYIPPILICQH